LLVLPGSAGMVHPATAWTRPDAAFLAQLIAAAQSAPQTRGRRRVEPAAASAIYGAAARLMTIAPAARCM